MHNFLAWLINPATIKLLSPFTAGTADSFTSSVTCWSTRDDLLANGIRPPVSTACFYSDPHTAMPLSRMVSNKPRHVQLLLRGGGRNTVDEQTYPLFTLSICLCTVYVQHVLFLLIA